MPTNRSSVAESCHMMSHDRHVTLNGHTHNGVDPYVLTKHMERLKIDSELQKTLDFVRCASMSVCVCVCV